MAYPFGANYNYGDPNQFGAYLAYTGNRGFNLAESALSRAQAQRDAQLAMQQQEADRAYQLQQAYQNQQLQAMQQQQQQQQAMFPQQQEAMRLSNLNTLFNRPSLLAFQQELAGMGNERRIADLAYQANLPINYMSPSSRAGFDLFASLIGRNASVGSMNAPMPGQPPTLQVRR